MPRSTLPVLLAASLAPALVGCRPSPPTHLGGFRLDMSQQDVVDESRRRPESACHLAGTRPRVAVCEGTRPGHEFRVVVVGDTTAYIRVRMQPEGPRPERGMRRFVSRFGEPAWRERPHTAPFEPRAGYHTLWLNRDSTRSLAMICAAAGLGPPCSAELARTSPAAVEAKLDTLLGIRR